MSTPFADALIEDGFEAACSGYDDPPAVSVAISLKRIADSLVAVTVALDDIHDVLAALVKKEPAA